MIVNSIPPISEFGPHDGFQYFMQGPQLAQHFDLHPNQTPDLKGRLMKRSAQVFGDQSDKAAEVDLKTLDTKIGY